MKATELMIDDFVLYNDDICIVDEIRVDNTAVLTALNTDVTSIDGDQVSVDEITPIPLTPEILEKNFSSTADWYFIGTDKFCFRIDKYKDKWDLYFSRDGKETNLRIKINYVHKLQHALRLCGIDKEIEI